MTVAIYSLVTVHPVGMRMSHVMMLVYTQSLVHPTGRNSNLVAQ